MSFRCGKGSGWVGRVARACTGGGRGGGGSFPPHAVTGLCHSRVTKTVLDLSCVCVEHARRSQKPGTLFTRSGQAGRQARQPSRRVYCLGGLNFAHSDLAAVACLWSACMYRCCLRGTINENAPENKNVFGKCKYTALLVLFMYVLRYFL